MIAFAYRSNHYTQSSKYILLVDDVITEYVDYGAGNAALLALMPNSAILEGDWFWRGGIKFRELVPVPKVVIGSKYKCDRGHEWEIVGASDRVFKAFVAVLCNTRMGGAVEGSELLVADSGRFIINGNSGYGAVKWNGRHLLV